MIRQCRSWVPNLLRHLCPCVACLIVVHLGGLCCSSLIVVCFVTPLDLTLNHSQYISRLLHFECSTYPDRGGKPPDVAAPATPASEVLRCGPFRCLSPSVPVKSPHPVPLLWSARQLFSHAQRNPSHPNTHRSPPSPVYGPKLSPIVGGPPAVRFCGTPPAAVGTLAAAALAAAAIQADSLLTACSEQADPEEDPMPGLSGSPAHQPFHTGSGSGHAEAQGQRQS